MAHSATNIRGFSVPIEGSSRPSMEAKRVLTATAELTLGDLDDVAEFLDTAPYKCTFSADIRSKVNQARQNLREAVEEMNQELAGAEEACL